MSIPSETRSLLTRAADLRVAGANWPDAAKQLAVGEAELRTLATDYQRDYDKLARRARTEAARETFDAALTALRGLLKSEDARVSLLAATTIVRYEMARLRRNDRAARGAAKQSFRNVHAFEPDLTPQQLGVRDREPNVSELAEVNNCSGVAAAKNVARTEPTRPVEHTVDQWTRKRSQLLTAPVIDQFLPAPTVRNGPRGECEPPDLRSWLATT